MSEVNGPTAGEQARANQIQEAARKGQSKSQQAKTLQAGMQSVASQPGIKKAQSAFDQVLEKMHEPLTPTALPKEINFESHLPQAQEYDHSFQKSSSEEPRHDSEDKDKKIGEDGKKSEGQTQSKGATSVRVQGKTNLKQQSHGDGSEKQDQYFHSKGKQEGIKEIESFQPKKLDQALAPSTPQMGGVTGVGPVGEVQAQDAPKTLSKALLDQIVQSVTILKRKDLDPEMTINLQDSVFNGLKIKVSGKDKMVSIEFVVPNRAVEELFHQERDQIAVALGKQGIEVRAMEIRMS